MELQQQLSTPQRSLRGPVRYDSGPRRSPNASQRRKSRSPQTPVDLYIKRSAQRSPQRKQPAETSTANTASNETNVDSGFLLKLAAQERRVKELVEAQDELNRELKNARRILRQMHSDLARRETDRENAEMEKRLSVARKVSPDRADTPLQESSHNARPEPLDPLLSAKKIAGDIKDMAYSFVNDLKELHMVSMNESADVGHDSHVRREMSPSLPLVDLDDDGDDGEYKFGSDEGGTPGSRVPSSSPRNGSIELTRS